MAADSREASENEARADHRTEELQAPKSRADLIALTGTLAGRRFIVDSRVVIGREAQGNGVQVPGDDVSRQHAAIWRTAAGEFVIEDLKSRNGTLINGTPIEVAVLRFGDKIQVGVRNLFVFTHHQDVEEQLVRWQRMELISQITSGLVHDLNNCLAVILGNIQTIQTHSPAYLDDEDLRQCLTEMEVMGWEGVNLARKVLNFARGAEPAQGRVDLAQVVQETVRLIRRSLPASIKVEQQLDNELFVLGDRSELMQVIINLVLNARDAITADSGKIRLEASRLQLSEEEARGRRLPVQGSLVVLRVIDSGTGMSEETRRRVFEPLFTTKAPGKGTGLGLSTVARIVERHQGHAAAESRQGAGSTFSLYFPAAAALAPASARTAEMVHHLPRGGAQAGLVLVLEAHEVMRQRAAHAALSAGCEVLQARTGEELLELHQRYQPRTQLVIINVDLLGEQLGPLLEQLRRRDPEVRVLALSGQQERRSKLTQEVSAVLGTPCDSRTFQEGLAVVLGKEAVR